MINPTWVPVGHGMCFYDNKLGKKFIVRLQIKSDYAKRKNFGYAGRYKFLIFIPLWRTVCKTFLYIVLSASDKIVNHTSASSYVRPV